MSLLFYCTNIFVLHLIYPIWDDNMLRKEY